jgi:hypothetical protein
MNHMCLTAHADTGTLDDLGVLVGTLPVCSRSLYRDPWALDSMSWRGDLCAVCFPL